MYWQMRDWLNGAAAGEQKKQDGSKNKKNNIEKAGKKGKTTTTSASKTSTSKESVTHKTALSKKVSGPSLLKLNEGGSKSATKVSGSASKEEAASGNVKVKVKKATVAKAVGTIPVRLNVYSLVKVNENIKYTGIGIYHSGTEVHNCEWAYGGHPLDTSGIFQMKKPRDLKSLSDIDGSFVFMQTLRIGFTSLTLEQVNALILRLGETWKGRQYHLLYKNCNSFSNRLCTLLCGHGIPDWVNRGATMLSYFPFVVQMIPKEYLTPQALKNQIKKKGTGKVGKGKLAKDEGKGTRKVTSMGQMKKETSSTSKLAQAPKSIRSLKSNASVLSIAPSPSGTTVVTSSTLGKMVKNGSTTKCKGIKEGEKTVTVMMDEQSGSTLEVPPDEVEQFKLFLKGQLKMEKIKMNVLDSEAAKEDESDDEVEKTGDWE